MKLKVLSLLILVLLSASVYAADCNPGDSCTKTGCGTSGFCGCVLGSGDTITQTGDLDCSFSSGITVNDGTWDGGGYTFTAGNFVSNAFSVNNGGSLTLQNITLAGGATSGVHFSGASGTLAFSSVSASGYDQIFNFSGGDGYTINASNGATCTNCTNAVINMTITDTTDNALTFGGTVQNLSAAGTTPATVIIKRDEAAYDTTWQMDDVTTFSSGDESDLHIDELFISFTHNGVDSSLYNGSHQVTLSTNNVDCTEDIFKETGGSGSSRKTTYSAFLAASSSCSGPDCTDNSCSEGSPGSREMVFADGVLSSSGGGQGETALSELPLYGVVVIVLAVLVALFVLRQRRA